MRKLKSSELVLHPTYGRNPTIPKCFWCGKARNEVVNLGNRIQGEAPMYATIDFKLCYSCAQQRVGKMIFVECQYEPIGYLPAIARAQGKPVYATGRWGTIENGEALQDHFDPVMKKALKNKSIAYVDRAMFETIFGATFDGTPPTEVISGGTGSSQSTA